MIESTIKNSLPDAIISSGTSDGVEVIQIKPETIVSVSKLLKENGFNYPADITGVDYKDKIELIYHLTSISDNRKVIIKTEVDREKSVIESVTSVWKGADWQEREVYDLLGVKFTGHPYLKRILLPEGWEGFPLRKDYVMPKDDDDLMQSDWAAMVNDDTDEDDESCYLTPDGSMVCTPGKMSTQTIQVSMGPQHPSTHGVLRLEVVLDGETVIECRPDVGYLHRGMEKLAEMRTYIQFIPLTDRFDYLASMMNNAAYVGAVEKLAGIEVPERAEYIRIIMMELQRIASHLVFMGTLGLDLGATTPFIYCFRDREDIIDMFELVCGARLTYNYFRPGGVSRDIPDEFIPKCKAFIKKLKSKLPEYDGLLTENEIFLLRMRDIGHISPEDVADYAMSGPNIRAAGIPYDVRKSDPYSIYDRFDFNVVTQKESDNLARYLVRTGEIRESIKIVEQALDGIPEGKLTYKLPAVFKVPEGEVYHHIESARGDLGVYIKSDGTPKPYRLKWRAPSFINLQAIPQMTKGWKVADVVAILGSIDIILGEVDR